MVFERSRFAPLCWAEDGTSQYCCHYCHAELFAPEAIRIVHTNLCRGAHCCAEGQILLQPIRNHEGRMRSLLANNWLARTVSMTYSWVLRTYPRVLNSALAMASQVVRRRAMPAGRFQAFVINTRVAHRLGPLLPNDRRPRFAQLYVFDPQFNDGVSERNSVRAQQLHQYFELAGRNRPSARVQQMLIEYMQELEVALRQVNPYIQDWVTAAEIIRSLPSEAQVGVRLVLDRDARPVIGNAPNAHHSRSFNPQDAYGRRALHPTQFNEIALLTTPTGLSASDFVLQARGGSLQDIGLLHRSFDPLYFVLLFPYGDDGWRDHLYKAPLRTIATDEALRSNSTRGSRPRDRITAPRFYAHRLHWRRGARYEGGRCVLMGGRLLQEYVCHAYARCELNRLNFFRHNQHNLRRDTYNNLRAEVNLAREEGRAVEQCGQPVTLPASFVGSPKDMHNRYMDALAVVRELGKPSLFITMTCNPKWSEIVESLPYGSKAEDHPEIVARVFHIKLQELMEDLTKRHVLGVTVAHMMVVEFQFRGLPHAHILLVMQNSDRISSADGVDNISVAELPPRSATSQRQQELRRLVLQHMVHNDCENNPTCECRSRTGSCRWHFPKSYQPHTVWSDEQLYPTVRRRAGAEYEGTTANGRLVDSRWIATYNPALLLKYDCHINVEVCASVEAVKYIYKVRLANCNLSLLCR